MILVSVNAYTFDLGGSVVLECRAEDTRAGDQFKRINRIATLDGGAAFNDFGFSQADRSIDIVWKPDEELDPIAERIHQLHSRVTVSTPQGIFLGWPENLEQAPAENRWRILVESKLNED